jgi:hypothetical protein
MHKEMIFGSYLRPIICDTLALSGTADTPAFPISGLIFLSSLKKRFINFTNSTPPKVAIINDTAPSVNMPIDCGVRNVVACVDAPTVSPIKIVTISISCFDAVSASLLVTPLSLTDYRRTTFLIKEEHLV